MPLLNWEILGLIISVLSSAAAILVKLNKAENEYRDDKHLLQELKKQLDELEKKLLNFSNKLQIYRTDNSRMRAQLQRDFTNLSWQLKIIVGSLEEVEKFLEKSSNYHRRRSCDLQEGEDTRGFMKQKLNQLGEYDSPPE